MLISIIVAVAENNVIGRDNRLLWHLPADMKFFKEKTSGHCVLMGRKSYESIPEKFRPLANRVNMVITRQRNFKAKGCIVVHSLEEAIAFAKNKSEIFIIGGGEIYRQVLPLANQIYMTQVFKKFEGDTFFPQLDENEWKQVHYEEHLPDEKNKHKYAFCTFVRK